MLGGTIPSKLKTENKYKYILMVCPYHVGHNAANKAVEAFVKAANK